jgi:hypothetical protein
MPLNFSSITPPSKSLSVNYNWVDIASGSGYVLFSGYSAWLTGGQEYMLVPRSFSAIMAGIETSPNLSYTIVANPASGAMALEGEIDFDSNALALPQSVNGEFICRVPVAANAVSGTGTMRVIVKLRKWDGATETEIASGQSVDMGFTGTHRANPIIKFNVDNAHYKKGETIRVTVEYWGDDTTGNFVYNAGHDPLDATIGPFLAGASELVVAIPFKINV